MERKAFTIQDVAGNAIRGASVLIKTYPGGVTATLYADNEVDTIDNPMTTDPTGQCFGKAANGHYTQVVSKTGITTETETDIVFFDPDDLTDQYAASGGAALVGFSPTGTVAATNVQAAIAEVDSEKASLAALAASTGSSLVGWIQSGVGAVLRWVQDKLRETVSPADFATLQQALDTGKVVRLVDGVTYPITSRLTIPTGGGMIGKGILTFSSANFTDTTKAITSTSVVLYAFSVDNITLRDFKMVGTCGQNSHIYPIAIRDVRKADVRGLDISGLNGGSMVLIDSSFDVSVMSNDFHDSTLDRSADSGQLTGVEVDDFRISGVGSERINVSHNRIKNLGWTSGFLASYGPQTDGVNIKIGAKNCVVAHNIMDGVGEGVDCFADDNIITDNVIKNALGYGLKLVHGASRNLLANNRIIDPGLGGIVVAGSNSATQNTDRNMIIDNLISGAGTNPGTYWVQPMYGIGINNDGTFKATNTMARGNRVISSSGANYAFQGATAGTGNAFVDNESDGTAGAEYGGSTYTVYKSDYLGEFLTGVARLYGTATRLILSETDAPANEKLWDTSLVAGDLSRRTRTDVDGTGATYELIQRTGSTVDLIQWNATAMRFGGIASSTRYIDFTDSGLTVNRRDDNGIPNFREIYNYGITASGQGGQEVYRFGVSGTTGGVAYNLQILATDTWAAAGNRSAKAVMKLLLANSQVTVAQFLPTGVILLGSTTNDSAASTMIGEIITSTVAVGSAVSLTNATGANVTSISLTAGDWDVSAQNDFVLTGATSTSHQSGISLTSATLPSQAGGSGLGTDPLAVLPMPTTGLSGTLTQPIPPVRISLAATTTVYLVGQAAFSVGSESVYGTIRARRVR